MLKQKASYFVQSALKHVTRTGFSCPSCGAAASTLVDKKYLVAALRRCSNCQLMFVAPTVSPRTSARFYQKRYKQGFTTELPTSEELAVYCGSDFRATDKDFGTYIRVIQSVAGPGSSVFDFGCSWGYGSWQIRKAGFNVEAYEISVPRADYARNELGIVVHSSLAGVRSGFDVVFSSHVLEHVHSVRKTLDFVFSILRPGGVFVCLTPNGSVGYRTRDPKAWHMSWGKVHPSLLDEIFYQSAFVDMPILLASEPYPFGEIRTWADVADDRPSVHDLTGAELLVLVKKAFPSAEASAHQLRTA